MTETVVTSTPLETRDLGNQVGSCLAPGDVIGVSGVLGSGKSVFAAGVAEALGIEEPLTSPTFTIVCEYPGRVNLYHIDLYRVSGQAEFELLGLDDVLYGDGVCVIEWPERAGRSLPEHTLIVSLEIIAPDQRRITFPVLQRARS